MMWRQWLLAIATGAAAFMLSWGAWHVKIDHDNFHAMLNYVIQAQQARAPAPGPAPAPAGPAGPAK